MSGPDRTAWAGPGPPSVEVGLCDLEAFGQGGEQGIVLLRYGGAAAEDEAVRAVDDDVLPDRPDTSRVMLGTVQAGSCAAGDLGFGDLEVAEAGVFELDPDLFGDFERAQRSTPERNPNTSRTGTRTGRETAPPVRNRPRDDPSRNDDATPSALRGGRGGLERVA